jgi:GAF domain-containing protein
MMDRNERENVLDSVCHGIGDAMHVAGASLCLGVDDEGCTPWSWSSPMAHQLHLAQASSGHGPCPEARASGVPVVVDDLATSGPWETERWVAFRAAARDCGAETALVHPLTGPTGTVGALALYDSAPRNWTAQERAAVGVVAQLLTALVQQQAEQAELRSVNERMRLALDHRAVIEQAKGMVARDHAVSVETAWERLRRHSRSTNTPVRDVSRAVVELGLMIPRPAAQPAGRSPSPSTAGAQR